MNKPWTSAVGQRALVTGATGMVGRALLARLGGHVVATSRDPSRLPLAASELVTWDGAGPLEPSAFEDVDAVFHLVGESVVGRWSDAKKERILRSRVDTTRALVRSIAAAPKRPRVLVSASAVGIYGDRGDVLLTEESPPGEGFLADVCRVWEDEAARARELGVRVVSLRFGVVLSVEGGALAQMLPAFRLGIGGRLGGGQQWMPWIHVDDVVGLLRFAAAHDALSGPVNAVAPERVTNATFTRALAKALHRPAFTAAPAFALRLALGEAASALLGSEQVAPARALEAGYRFQHPTLANAFADLFPARGRIEVAQPSA